MQPDKFGRGIIRKVIWYEYDDITLWGSRNGDNEAMILIEAEGLPDTVDFIVRNPSNALDKLIGRTAEWGVREFSVSDIMIAERVTVTELVMAKGWLNMMRDALLLPLPNVPKVRGKILNLDD